MTTLDRMNELIGRGWPRVTAEILGVSTQAVHRQAKVGDGTDRLSLLVEFFETVHPTKWPERWRPLAEFKMLNDDKGTSP